MGRPNVRRLILLSTRGLSHGFGAIIDAHVGHGGGDGVRVDWRHSIETKAGASPQLRLSQHHWQECSGRWSRTRKCFVCGSPEEVDGDCTGQ